VKTLLTYRNISITEHDLKIIQEVLANNPNDSRRKISYKVCRLFNWVQSNGALRDMVCRSLLLCLERAGHITQPPPRRTVAPSMRAARNCIQTSLALETTDTSPVESTVGQLKPLTIQQVRRTASEKLYRHLMQQYHYLGYCQPVGEHLKYVISAAGRPIACMAFSSAPRHIGSRDRFICWDQHQRRKNIHLIAYNTRFLILPWVHVPNLASHLLGQMARRISADWQQLYNHPIYYLETFVDTERFAGTCYKAANWLYLGLTTGRGKNDQTMKQNRSLKAVWGYPLVSDFRQRLLHG
jgi:hypothetical protein